MRRGIVGVCNLRERFVTSASVGWPVCVCRPQAMISVSDGLRLRGLVARHSNGSSPCGEPYAPALFETTKADHDTGAQAAGQCERHAVHVRMPAKLVVLDQSALVKPEVLQSIQHAIQQSGLDVSTTSTFQVTVAGHMLAPEAAELFPAVTQHTPQGTPTQATTPATTPTTAESAAGKAASARLRWWAADQLRTTP